MIVQNIVQLMRHGDSEEIKLYCMTAKDGMQIRIFHQEVRDISAR